MTRYSYLSHLQCSKCGEWHDATVAQGLCTRCGSPLLARYDLDALRADVRRDDVHPRAWELWRYHELLPSLSADDELHLGEVVTPLLKLRRHGQLIGLDNLLIKDESATPTSTFKARGAAVGVSRAAELGITHIAMPTNGNAGAAWAAYAARAGLQALIVMPEDAPTVTRAECIAAGAQVHLVDGVISDAGAMAADAVANGPWVDVATLKEPYRIEGKKTMGLEIVEQLGWQLPDVVVYPTGGGVGIIGIHKAIEELLELGWVEGAMPRFVAVQASGCAPVVTAFEHGASESTFWADSKTIAFGINVPKPLGDFIILEILARTSGTAVAVTDADLLRELRALGENEGIFVCPEGAAAMAAVRELTTQGWIRRDETVVVLNTGAGIKYPDCVDTTLPVHAAGTKLSLDEADSARGQP